MEGVPHGSPADVPATSVPAYSCSAVPQMGPSAFKSPEASWDFSDFNSLGETREEITELVKLETQNGDDRGPISSSAAYAVLCVDGQVSGEGAGRLRVSCFVFRVSCCVFHVVVLGCTTGCGQGVVWGGAAGSAGGLRT